MTADQSRPAEHGCESREVIELGNVQNGYMIRLIAYSWMSTSRKKLSAQHTKDYTPIPHNEARKRCED